MQSMPTPKHRKSLLLPSLSTADTIHYGHNRSDRNTIRIRSNIHGFQN